MNFFWLIPHKIAGGSLPRTPSDIEILVNYKIKHVISLIENPSEILKLTKGFDIKMYSIPIVDFSIPTQSQIQQFLSLISKNIEHNQATFVHCFGGCGRTGTMLAVYLVHSGYNAFDAIKRVRELRPCSMETEEQEQVILDFENARGMEK